MRKVTEKNLEVLYELLKGFEVALMTTVSREGLLLSRPMMAQEPIPDADLWFVTSLDTEKVRDIEVDPRLNLGYYRDSDKAWVSVSGKGRIERDSTRIKEMWKESWRIWFPEGPDDPDLVLIKVEVEHVIYWKPEAGKISVLFSLAKAYVTGQPPELDPPRSMDMRPQGKGEAHR